MARGGMAEVWVGSDTVLERQVAIKILHPSLAADDPVRERFRREARAAARVTHPNIVSVYDTGTDDDTVYIVMEYVHGETLRRLLDASGPLPAERALAIASQVADALDFAHRQGLVHRDMKPANVLVDRDGRARVVDFGIATAVGGGGDLTGDGKVVGTARYLAPEQVTGDAVDARTDVYGLALVLYEMLAGAPAFGGETELGAAVARLTGDPPSLAARGDDLDPAIVGAVDRALERDPDARWESAAAFRDALHGVVHPVAAAPVATERDVTDEVPVPVTADPTQVARSAEPHTAVITTQGPPPNGDEDGTPGGGWSRGRWLALAALGTLAVVVGVAAALTLGSDDDTGGETFPAAVGIVGGADFDPQGDGSENPETVPEAFDGNPSTGWRTQTYTTRDLGGLKDGVGLRVDLDGGFDLAAVLVETDSPGWSAEVFVADAPGATLEDWGAPRGGGVDLGTSARIDLEPGTSGSTILLWVTHLPEGGRIVVHDIAPVR